MEKLGLVGHLVPIEKEKIKTYIKGLPSEMLTIVRVSKVSTFWEAIEEAQLVEDANGAGEKRKMEE